LSRKLKARQRLEQSREKGDLKARIRLNEEKLVLAEARLSLAAQQYEDTMIFMYKDADPEHRALLEAEYKKVAGSSLKSVLEARIIAALQSQPRGDCDLSQAV
jgi:hypothetical protein